MEESTTQAFRGVVTPRPLLPDEIASMVVLERFQEAPVPEIRFLESSECSSEQIDELIEEGFFPIEVGEMSYKAIGVGSATEAVIRNLGLDPANLNSGETKLVELMARRNNNGHLNQGYMSIPRIFGNLYDLGYDETDLIERFKDVVRAFLDDKNRKAEGERPEREDVLMEEELSDLVQATKKEGWEKCQFTSFTPSRYLRDMWRLGVPVNEIREKISFWVNAWNRFQEEYAKAKVEWPKIEKVNFSVNGFSGTAVETDNRFITKVAAPTVDILINRRPDGHGAILTLGRNVSSLSQKLQRIEPGKWYYHKSAGHLINGSSSPASELSLVQLVELAKNFPPK